MVKYCGVRNYNYDFNRLTDCQNGRRWGKDEGGRMKDERGSGKNGLRNVMLLKNKGVTRASRGIRRESLKRKAKSLNGLRGVGFFTVSY